MISVKQHKNVLAACDRELIGKHFEEGDKNLDISKRFFCEKGVTGQEFVELLKSADNTNLVGEKTINCAIKAGIIDKKNLMKIKGIPYAQIYSF